ESKEAPSSTQTTYEGKKMVDSEGRFFSPLVRKIAEKENISSSELRIISGSGAGGKVTKADILAYLQQKKQDEPSTAGTECKDALPGQDAAMPRASEPEEIGNMRRVRQSIAAHMVQSLETAAHVTAVMEADMTNIVQWRTRNKKVFREKYGINLTYTPILVNVLAGLLREFPYLNASVRDNQVILKKYINIGIATALEDNTLIVPAIKNADEYNLVGIAKITHDLVTRARASALKPDEVRQGTFTLTNIGTFGNLIGTPIINQPQVAIL